jgi:hypothetical protein
MLNRNPDLPAAMFAQFIEVTDETQPHSDAGPPSALMGGILSPRGGLLCRSDRIGTARTTRKCCEGAQK